MLYIGSISASPTARPSRGCGHAVGDAELLYALHKQRCRKNGPRPVPQTNAVEARAKKLNEQTGVAIDFATIFDICVVKHS